MDVGTLEKSLQHHALCSVSTPPMLALVSGTLGFTVLVSCPKAMLFLSLGVKGTEMH